MLINFGNNEKNKEKRREGKTGGERGKIREIDEGRGRDEEGGGGVAAAVPPPPRAALVFEKFREREKEISREKGERLIFGHLKVLFEIIF